MKEKKETKNKMKKSNQQIQHQCLFSIKLRSGETIYSINQNTLMADIVGDGQKYEK